MIQLLNPSSGGGSQTPWTSNIDGGAFSLTDVGKVIIGSSADDGTGLPLQITGAQITHGTYLVEGASTPNNNPYTYQTRYGFTNVVMGANSRNDATYNNLLFIGTNDSAYADGGMGLGIAYFSDGRIVMGSAIPGVAQTPLEIGASYLSLNGAGGGEGNVGVGYYSDDSSGAKLQVNGSISIYGGIIDTLNSTGAGTTGQVLTSNGSGWSWQNAGGGSQTPWTSDIDGGAFSLKNVANGYFGAYTPATGGTTTESPYSYSFTLAGTPIVPNSVSGTDAWYGTFNDDGAGNIVAMGNTIGVLDYATGYYSDWSGDTINDITYAYGTPAYADVMLKPNGVYSGKLFLGSGAGDTYYNENGGATVTINGQGKQGWINIWTGGDTSAAIGYDGGLFKFGNSDWVGFTTSVQGAATREFKMSANNGWSNYLLLSEDTATFQFANTNISGNANFYGTIYDSSSTNSIQLNDGSNNSNFSSSGILSLTAGSYVHIGSGGSYIDTSPSALGFVISGLSSFQTGYGMWGSMNGMAFQTDTGSYGDAYINFNPYDNGAGVNFFGFNAPPASTVQIGGNGMALTPRGTPGVAVEGQMYVDNSAGNHLYIYLNGSWNLVI